MQTLTRSPGMADFRQVIGHFTSGVAVVTTRHGGRPHGMTASAVCSVSLEPPMLLVCASTRSPTQEAIQAAGRFAVNILREEQDELALRFAGPREDKFAGLAVEDGPAGMPVLSDALARIECEVAQTVVGGTHRVFLGIVRSAELTSGSPLAYFRGRFGKLELAADERALDALRRMVLVREHPLDTPLDPDALAALTGTDAASIHYVLARLVAEGLVTRMPAGYLQVPLDVATSDEALEAKLAIDLAAARLALGRAGDAELDVLVALAAAIPAAGQAAGEHVEATEAFHEAMIALAGNGALLRAYRQLSLPGISLRILAADPADLDHLTADHVAIARAMRRRDEDGVAALMATHSEHGRELHRAAIARAGGRL